MARDIRRAQGARLKEARQAAGYRSAREAALENEWPESTYRAHESGTRTIGQDDAEKYVRRFRTATAHEILFPASVKQEPLDNRELVHVNELDFRGGSGGGGMDTFDQQTRLESGIVVSQDAVRAEWGLPTQYLRGELRMRSPGEAIIIEVYGDSGYNPDNPYAPGSLFPGDRVIVDTGDKLPSPPGPFAVFDGVGLVIKLVEVIPQTEPVQLRLSSRNPNYPPYEVAEGEGHVIGRVRGRISAM